MKNTHRWSVPAIGIIGVIWVCLSFLNLNKEMIELSNTLAEYERNKGYIVIYTEEIPRRNW